MLTFKAFASGSNGNLYTVEDGQTKLLIECGLPLAKIKQALSFKLCEITACFVSHAHKDHSKAASGLLRVGVEVYTNQDTTTACGLTGHRIRMLTPLTELTVGTFKVLPFDVQHDVPALGFLFTSTVTGEKLLYFTDTFYLKYHFQGLTVIAAECNYDRETLRQNVAAGIVPPEQAARLAKSHMSLENLLDMLRANDLARVRQIYLLHMSDNNSDAQRCREAVQKLTGAEVYIC